jgi:hypothetical protein
MTELRPTKYSNFYQKYKNLLLFNKNLILSGRAAFFSGAIFTQLLAQQQAENSNNLLNAAATLLLEYGAYIPLFGILFYLDNKHRYTDPITHQNNSNQIKKAFSMSELIYSVSKVLVQYYLLEQNIQPYQSFYGSSACCLGNISCFYQYKYRGC